MGSCFTRNPKESQNELLRLADRSFRRIDKKNNKKINSEDLENYFSEFSSSISKIFLAEIDFNQDGYITRNQWIGYWEYVRLAGYPYAVIKKELIHIMNGEAPQTSFVNARDYKSTQPRQSVVDNVVSDLKSLHDCPVILQN